MFLDRLCKITFIAHGATIFSEEFRFSDLENYPPLNEAGEEEIGKICEFLKKRTVKNDKIYTSSGTRAVESAEIIAKTFKTDYEVVEDLKPRLCGGWNNKTVMQVLKKDFDSLEKMLKNPTIGNDENSESLVAFADRVNASIQKIISENHGNRIIIVTYPEVIQAAIVSALDLPPERMLNFFIKTGSATQISYYKRFNSLKYAGFAPI